MCAFDRKIKIAYEKNSGLIINADEIFNKKTDGFEIRKLFHYKQLNYYCCECNQELNISGSKYDRLHFKHKPKHETCLLSTGVLNQSDFDGFINILKAKESDRHKDLKKKIGKLLLDVEGIDKSTVCIDNKFIIRGNEKRKPDVYCKYFDKEIVFEIQLSDLSLGYILNRYEFYKKNGIYLIWILDNFNIKNPGTLERDIKYLAKHQNFFKLDENSDDFKLICDYKFCFLKDGIIQSKWTEKSVGLNQFFFDNIDFQIFYYNFSEFKNKLEIEKKKQEFEKKVQEKELKLKISNEKVDTLVYCIKNLKQNGCQDYSHLLEEFCLLSIFEIRLINEKMKLKELVKSKPAISLWVIRANQNDAAFLEFIISNPFLEFDINMVDNFGKTAFQEVLENKKLPKHRIIKALLKRGYKLTKEDVKNYLGIFEKDNDKYDLVLFLVCSRLKNKALIDEVFLHCQCIFILESIINKEIVGFKYKQNDWLAFIINALINYKEYWNYIEDTLKKTKLWEIIRELDRKKSFEDKIVNYYREVPLQKLEFNALYEDLYFEIDDC
ncbi:MAG TPA: hypothetical protein DEA97_21475 [Bacteroidales bacterium]|nr:MAG: hypothetical protein UR43_C0014G0012 [candidate division TM6 bacterium GW2011_GWF2_33_332]HBS89132.1 hypothetical protein [Bacteroidales bacterium]